MPCLPAVAWCVRHVIIRRLFSYPLLCTMGRKGSILQIPSTTNLISCLPGYSCKHTEKIPVLDFSIFLWVVQPSNEPVNKTSEAELGQTMQALRRSCRDMRAPSIFLCFSSTIFCDSIIASAIFPSNIANFARIDRNLSRALMTSFSWNSHASESSCNSLEVLSRPW